MIISLGSEKYWHWAFLSHSFCSTCQPAKGHFHFGDDTHNLIRIQFILKAIHQNIYFCAHHSHLLTNQAFSQGCADVVVVGHCCYIDDAGWCWGWQGWSTGKMMVSKLVVVVVVIIICYVHVGGGEDISASIFYYDFLQFYLLNFPIKMWKLKGIQNLKNEDEHFFISFLIRIYRKYNLIGATSLFYCGYILLFEKRCWICDSAWDIIRWIVIITFWISTYIQSTPTFRCL